MMRTVFTLGLVMLFSGCAATKAYQGDRAAGELATIYFYSQGVELSEMRVDSTTQGIFDLGLSVAPGRHEAFAKFKGSSNDCTEWYGCHDIVYEGECRADIDVEAGQSYAIRVSGYGETLLVDVRRKDNNERAGGGSCRTTYTHREWESGSTNSSVR